MKLLSRCRQGMLSSQSLVAVGLLPGSLTYVQVKCPCWLLAGFISCFFYRSVSRTTGNTAVCCPESKDLRKRGKGETDRQRKIEKVRETKGKMEGTHSQDQSRCII